MFKQWVDTAHNQNVFPLRESNSITSGNDSHLRTYLEVHSLNSDQAFLSIQLKTFPKFSGWTFTFFLLLNCIIVYFIYLRSKAVIGLIKLFPIFFSILLKFSNWS